jgi:hypothetical protein
MPNAKIASVGYISVIKGRVAENTKSFKYTVTNTDSGIGSRTDQIILHYDIVKGYSGYN